MNPTIELLQNHRSIRRFTEQAISEELLSQIITSGQAAATSSYIQSVSIIRVSDPDLRQAFVELTGKQRYISTCSEFLVFCADLHRNQQRIQELGAEPDFAWTEQFLTAALDVALVAQNVVTAAESESIGICYIGGVRNDPERVIELLDLPKLVFPLFGLCLGYPDQHPEQKPRLPQAVVMHQNRYCYSETEQDLINQYDAHVKEYYIARTNGKLSHTWSEQMQTVAEKQTRPFIQEILQKQGFASK